MQHVFVVTLFTLTLKNKHKRITLVVLSSNQVVHSSPLFDPEPKPLCSEGRGKMGGVLWGACEGGRELARVSEINLASGSTDDYILHVCSSSD